MKLQAWEEVDNEQLNPHLGRKVIHGQNVTIARLELRKGGVVPEHSHMNEQVSMVQSGAIKFVSNGAEHIVRAGECLTIPPNVPHRVDVLEDSLVVDIFSPAREDWIRGDDAYLRR
jgi:quercetin dioxygenase-like cupin family protein